jgi:hypothetical protein
MSLVLVFPVVAVSPIWNRHFHKPGSIKKRVNSTPLRVMIPPILSRQSGDNILCQISANTECCFSRGVAVAQDVFNSLAVLHLD